IAVNFTNRGRQRCQGRLHAWGQFKALQTFEHLLAREVIVHLIIKRGNDKRQSKLGVREEAYRVREATQGNFYGNGDLLLHLLSSMPWKQADHRHLNVGDIGKGFDWQRLERHDTTSNEEAGQDEQKKRLKERKSNDAFDHDVPPHAMALQF